MKRKISMAIMILLAISMLLALCPNVSADGRATFFGRVRPIPVTGTVYVSGGGDSGSFPIGLSGFYSVGISLKDEGCTCTVTAETNRGTESKKVDNVKTGTYIINFNFGSIISIPQSGSGSTSLISALLNMLVQAGNNALLGQSNFQRITNNNPIGSGQNTL